MKYFVLIILKILIIKRDRIIENEDVYLIILYLE